MSDTTLSTESAREQLDELYKYYEIDIKDLPKAIQPALEGADKKLLNAIRMGRLEITLDEKDVIKVVQRIKNGDPLTYREIDGKAKVAMGQKDENDSYGKAYALMGALCGLGESAIEQLKGKDISLVECLGTVFLQA